MKRRTTDDEHVGVFTSDEEVDHEVHGTGADFRVVMLSMEIRVKKTDTDPADRADALAREVEEALTADRTLGGILKWMGYEGTTEEHSADHEKAEVELTVTYKCLYRVDASDMSSFAD